MNPPRRNRSLILALYANAVLLLAIVIMMASRGGRTTDSAAYAAPLTNQPIAGNGSLYLMPGQLLNNVWGCYVLDIDTQILCTYAYNGSQLRLMASRSIRYDHQLSNYNTHPDPDEIRRLVEIEKGHIRGVAQPADKGPGATQDAPRAPE